MYKIYKEFMDSLRKSGKVSVLDYGTELVKKYKISFEKARKIVNRYIKNFK